MTDHNNIHGYISHESTYIQGATLQIGILHAAVGQVCSREVAVPKVGMGEVDTLQVKMGEVHGTQVEPLTTQDTGGGCAPYHLDELFPRQLSCLAQLLSLCTHRRTHTRHR